MLIFLYGPDTYRLKEKLKKMKEKFIREVDSSGVNIVAISGEKMDMEKFRDAAAYGGFLVSKRMVIVENLIGKNKSQKIQGEVLDYLKKMPKEGSGSENIIIFTEEMEIGAKKDKKPKGGKLLEFLKKGKYAEEFPLLSGHKLSQWIEKEVQNRGGEIEGRAVSLLAEFVGSDLWRMSNEIDKLIALKKAEAISVGDVSLLVKAKVDENIFNLVDAIGSKNKKRALKLLKGQMEAGAAWGYVLSMLVRQFRILLQVKEASERGGSGNLAAKIGLHPFVAQKAAGQARNYEMGELKRIYRQLLEIDVKLKTTRINPEVLFDLLVISN